MVVCLSKAFGDAGSDVIAAGLLAALPVVKNIRLDIAIKNEQ
jgi:hypothetical protein